MRLMTRQSLSIGPYRGSGGGDDGGGRGHAAGGGNGGSGHLCGQRVDVRVRIAPPKAAPTPAARADLAQAVTHRGQSSGLCLGGSGFSHFCGEGVHLKIRIPPPSPTLARNPAS
jgi:hypothetical protein